MKKQIIGIILGAVLVLSIGVVAYAATGGFTMSYLPGTSDTVTNIPAADEGITGGEAYTVSSTIPQRAGYEFIDWTLDYGVGYKVTYVVNPDKKYGTPDGSTVPSDPKVYAPGEMVDVHDQLTTTVDYAYNEKGEKVKGAWEFVTWDKDDFAIYEDTTITGGWIFTEAPTTKYHYFVEYWLWDGKNMIKQVHARKEVEIDSLGILRREDAIPLDQLKKPYSVMKNGKYLYYIVTPYQEKLISKDGYIIYILYAEIPKGRDGNPNTVLLTYEVYGDPIYGLPDDVTVPDKKAYSKGNTVEVAEPLVTARDYAMLNGEKVPGTWTFTGWDKTGDFVINADTTVTGSWIFMPAEEPEPEKRASCTVRYLNQDGTPLAPEITYTGRRAGMQIRAEAKPIEGYSLTSDEVITITLAAGDSNIFTFYYEKIAEQEPVKEETPEDAAKDAPKDALKDAPTDPPLLHRNRLL